LSVLVCCWRSVTLLVGWAVFAIAGGYVLLNGAYRLAAARHGR